jgi:hypothetical protein
MTVDWIELLKHVEQAVRIRNAFSAIEADRELFRMLVIYGLAFVWLVYRAVTGYRSAHCSDPYDGAHVIEELLGALRCVVLLTLGVLLALARAAGRSHFRW